MTLKLHLSLRNFTKHMCTLTKHTRSVHAEFHLLHLCTSTHHINAMHFSISFSAREFCEIYHFYFMYMNISHFLNLTLHSVNKRTLINMINMDRTYSIMILCTYTCIHCDHSFWVHLWRIPIRKVQNTLRTIMKHTGRNPGVLLMLLLRISFTSVHNTVFIIFVHLYYVCL